MISGISTACLYPMETETALLKLCELGFKTLEIFINSPREIEPEYLRSLKSTADAYGAKIVSVHPFCSSYEPFMFFSDYMRRFEDMLEFYRRFFEAANILGADILVMHGGRNVKNIPDEDYIARFESIVRLGLSYGVRVAHENVAKYRCETAEFAGLLRRELGEHAFFVLDFKQAIRAGQPLEDMISAMGGNIIHVHVSDFTSESDCVLPAPGGRDFLSAYNAIKKQGCSPKWIIEVYSRCFSELSELTAAHDYLRSQIISQ